MHEPATQDTADLLRAQDKPTIPAPALSAWEQVFADGVWAIAKSWRDHGSEVAQ